LNWAARYYPIMRMLDRQISKTSSVLEIGAGPFGIGRFRRTAFVGCDVSFPCRPNPPMLPLLASATKLPFEDRSFDGVVLSDVLEHIPPNQRMTVVQESLRVARKVAIFAFPSGNIAFEYDLKLADDYERSGQERPEWLKEHFQYQPFPNQDLFDDLPDAWAVSSFDNENVSFHNWVMRREMHKAGIYLFRVLLAAIPGVMEYLLRHADRPPCYRKIVIVERAG
jgi:hypothetical protein